MKFKDLAPEKIDELKKLGSSSEVLSFLEKEGVELAPEELDLINGGLDELRLDPEAPAEDAADGLGAFLAQNMARIS